MQATEQGTSDTLKPQLSLSLGHGLSTDKKRPFSLSPALRPATFDATLLGQFYLRWLEITATEVEKAASISLVSHHLN